MKKDEIVAELIAAKEQVGKLRSKLYDAEEVDRSETAKKYIGKCYKIGSWYFEREKDEDKKMRCVMFYGQDGHNMKGMEVSYYPNQQDTWFEIEYAHTYYIDKLEARQNGLYDPEDVCMRTEMDEIPREEFMQHYNEVQKRLTAIINL
jgi:hypothetical protein